MIFKDKSPKITAHRNPNALFKSPLPNKIKSCFINCKINAPKITGIESKKENLKASSFFNPAKIDEAIVLPDLDIPGKIAKA